MKQTEFYLELKELAEKLNLDFSEYNEHIELQNDVSSIKMYDCYIRFGCFGSGYIDLPYSSIEKIRYAYKTGIIIFLNHGGYIATKIFCKDSHRKDDWMIDDTHYHLEDSFF